MDTITGLAGALTIGDPLDPETKIGPLVSSRQRERVEGFIAKGKQEARLTAGGSRPSSQTGDGSNRTDGLRRRGQQRGDLPRGDLRAGTVCHPLLG